VILTAGPAGSEGAAVSVDFSLVGRRLVLVSATNSLPGGIDSPLPIRVEFPQLNEPFRVELINSICICDAGIGTGLAAGQSHQLGTVVFNTATLASNTYEFTSDIEGVGDGVLDGDGNEIPKQEITFNSAFLIVDLPSVPRNPRWRHTRKP
jgi:hypothetical protein